MKNAIMSLVIIAGIFGTATTTSCNSSEKNGSANKEVYECPMKCEGKTFSEAGKCPVCGMDLVKVEQKEDGKAH